MGEEVAWELGGMDSAGKRSRWVVWDVVCILAVSLLAEMVFFSAPQGRAVISADSVQYGAAADALLSGEGRPHFEMRKPGYVLWLWLVGTVAGNMGWAAIAANHLLLAMLPVGAYGFGELVRSRVLGWLAAVVTIAQLETAVWGNRMMSESLYAVLLTFGMLAACAGVKRWGDARRSRGFDVCWLVAGTLLGLAWLTRGTAAAVIAAVVVVMIGAGVWEFVQTRQGMWKRVTQIGAFVAPVMVLITFECALNGVTAGKFATSTGTRGAALLLRMTYQQWELLPHMPEAKTAMGWIPEREWGEAFVGSEIDVWVARHRALHDEGMSEWEYDALMGRLGAEMVRRDPMAFAASSSAMMWHHLLRRGDGREMSPVPPDARRATIEGAGAGESGPFWWSMPELHENKRQMLVARMESAAAQKAPFGGAATWDAMRYGLSRWPASDVMRVLRAVGGALVVAGLLAGLAFGADRRLFVLLAVVMVAEAALVGVFVITTDRFQFVWVAMDSAAAGAAIVIPVSVIYQSVKAWIKSRSGAAEWSVAA